MMTPTQLLSGARPQLRALQLAKSTGSTRHLGVTISVAYVVYETRSKPLGPIDMHIFHDEVLDL